MADLSQIARQAMLDRALDPDFTESVKQELTALQAPAQPAQPFRDMRNLFFVSIDNDDSLDLDQLTYAEQKESGNPHIYIAVADVEALVKAGTAIDAHAQENTTSVYTPTIVFPMLPEKLSTDLTSLNPNVDRTAVVIELQVDQEGQFIPVDIYPAWVHNQAKLTYKGVGAFLDTKDKATLPTLDGLAEQLLLQDKISQRMKENRYRQGSLSFGTIEVVPSIDDEGQVVGLQETVHNRANSLIENFMIAANVAASRFLIERKFPTFQRVVKTPLKWDRICFLAEQKGTKLPPSPDVKALRDFLIKERNRDPLHFPDLSLAVIKLIGRGEYVVRFPGQPAIGHFDLALHDYAHTTAPNRRYPDLIMQRMLKAYFYGKTQPYRDEELVALAEHCTIKEDDATKVERRVRKSAAAMVLQPQIGNTFDALVTGAGEKGTWVRLITPPVEGKLVKGFEGLDVGDRVRVKLTHVDVTLGHIDFVKA